ncbi:MAG TPA: peptide deformylase, partial [Elusimicrobia bacterium]|nr:peptide deformylase [Elusimicrobiota bacterium]
KIRRSRWVKVTGMNEKGKLLDIEAEGILATVFQHEIDHLEGKVFIDRLPLWKRWKIWRQIRRILIKTDKIQDSDR